MEDKDGNFRRYAELKIEEKKIKAALDLINPVIKDLMQKANADKVPSDWGTFTLKPVSVWKYSKAVEVLEKKVDKLKAEEKSEGIAEADVRYDLVFKAKEQ